MRDSELFRLSMYVLGVIEEEKSSKKIDACIRVLRMNLAYSAFKELIRFGDRMVTRPFKLAALSIPAVIEFAGMIFRHEVVILVLKVVIMIAVAAILAAFCFSGRHCHRREALLKAA
jgi:hypothetical protein